MPLVNMHDMLYHAYNNNYAVGAFDLVSLDFLEAVIEAAESCRSSIILSIAEPHFIIPQGIQTRKLENLFLKV